MISGVKVTFQNVVASARLKQKVDLDAVVRAFPEVEYKPEIFPGLPFKLKNPKTCILIFKTGGMVCTGAKSTNDARKAVMKVAKELKKRGIVMVDVKPEIMIQNIVASGSIEGVTIDVEKLHESARFDNEIRTMYEPEQFPGLIYRMEDPRVVFLVFSTGKLVCVGAKREEDVYKAIERLVSMLEEWGVLYRRVK